MITCLAGALLATRELDVKLIRLLIYATSGSISAFVLNDLADVHEDGSLGRFRNPLVSGELSFNTAIKVYLITASISMTSLIGFNVYAYTLALTTLALSYLYSIGIRFKELIPMDLVVHGLTPALLATTAYLAYKPLDIDSILLSSMVLTSSTISEVLQEIRDLNSISRSTVKLLGIKRSKDLILVLTIMTSLLYVLLTLGRYDLNYLVIYTPLTYLILGPVLKFRNNYLSVEEVITKLRFRATVLVSIVIATYVALNINQYAIR